MHTLPIFPSFSSPHTLKYFLAHCPWARPPCRHRLWHIRPELGQRLVHPLVLQPTQKLPRHHLALRLPPLMIRQGQGLAGGGQLAL